MTVLVFQDLLVAIAGARIDQRVEQGFVIDLGVQGSPQARPPSESSQRLSRLQEAGT
ncbi:hypothetical protein D3C75_1056470 [compost metagenome]